MSDRRKLSEAWTKGKADEFCKTDSDLTFAEWCYEQGEKEGARKFAEWLVNHMFNGCDKFWKNDTPNDEPLCIKDFINEYFREKEQKK